MENIVAHKFFSLSFLKKLLCKSVLPLRLATSVMLSVRITGIAKFLRPLVTAGVANFCRPALAAPWQLCPKAISENVLFF